MPQQPRLDWRPVKEPPKIQFSLRALLQMVLSTGFCCALIVQPESSWRLIGWLGLAGVGLYVYFFYFDLFNRDS